LRGLVSFSLFGDQPLYTVGAVRNAEMWANSDLFPSDIRLECRFYVGNSVPEECRRHLIGLGAEVVPVSGRPEDQTATFWRYDASGDSEFYDFVLFRDVDSRPNAREVAAIRDWLGTNRTYHFIRDHPYHGVPILAGLWGARSWGCAFLREALPMVPPADFYQSVNRRIGRDDYTSNDFYQVDQWWLRLKVYPEIKHMSLSHDEFFGFERRRWRLRMPPRPADFSFVGEGFNEFDEPRFPEHRDLIRQWPKKGS
jgi:hypothetical protein